MSALSEANTERLTVGVLRERYGLQTDDRYGNAVTITSLADDVQSVTPGALFMPTAGEMDDPDILLQAERRGAYAVLLPLGAQPLNPKIGIPVLYGDLDMAQRGRMASDIAGSPSESIIVFVVAGEGAVEYVRQLASLLHMLGNPVGLVGYRHSFSLDRQLVENYPLGELDLQRILSVFVEDGASAAVIGADEETLRAGALASVSIDVCAVAEDDYGLQPSVKDTLGHYGAVLVDRTRLAHCTAETDELARAYDPAADEVGMRRLSLCLAMLMKVGVRRNNLKKALNVFREMH